MWILYVLALLLIIIAVVSNNLVSTLIHVKRTCLEDCIRGEEERGNISIAWYDSLSKKEITAPSQYGYDLYIQLIEHPVKTKNTVVLVHGYSCNLAGSIKYAGIFYDMGFNVVLYDHGNCGRSGGNVTTMGYREKNDLKAVVRRIRKELGEDIRIGLHGESMGASTALLYGACEPGLNFIVEDCGYSDLTKELAYQLRIKYKLPYFPFIPTASFICKLRGGFYFAEISPVRDMRQSAVIHDTPVLFIHGAEDHFTPPWMLEELYEAKKGKKMKYLAPGAGHAESFAQDKAKYAEIVAGFLKMCMD